MKVAVIGAGFTGLSAAYDLAKAGNQVTIFEAASQAGGLASGFKEPHWDWHLEKYYHHWFASDRATKQLLADSGLSQKLIFSKPSTAVYFKKRFFPLDSPRAILHFPGFNFREKIQFAAATAHLKYLTHWQTLEKSSVDPWLPKHYGPNPYQLIWEPLLQGKFGPYYRDVTMAWMWARLKARTPSLGTYRGGFQACIDDLVKILKAKGVTFYLNLPISQIQPSAKGFSLIAPHQKFTCDSILLTTPPQISQSLAPYLPKTYLGPLLNQPFLSALMLILALKKQLSTQNFYWHNLPKTQNFPFLALVEHTNFISPKYFGGDHIVYCGDYLTPNHPNLSLSPDSLLKAFLPGIQKINPSFNPSWINKYWVYKSEYAQPVPGINHSHIIPPVNSPVKGLYLACMAQVYPWDRGTNFAIDIGRRAAALILAQNL